MRSVGVMDSGTPKRPWGGDARPPLSPAGVVSRGVLMHSSLGTSVVTVNRCGSWCAHMACRGMNHPDHLAPCYCGTLIASALPSPGSMPLWKPPWSRTTPGSPFRRSAPRRGRAGRRRRVSGSRPFVPACGRRRRRSHVRSCWSPRTRCRRVTGEYGRRGRPRTRSVSGSNR